MHDCAGCDECQFDELANVPNDVHEIHITVKTDDVVGFRLLCELNDIKAIVIGYNSKSTGESLTDPMTSHGFRGNNKDALEEAKRIACMFESNGYEPVRIKIETTPTNPIAGTLGDGYWESHLAVSIPVIFEPTLRKVISGIGVGVDGRPVHMSRNAFKKDEDFQTIMVTHRRGGKISYKEFLEETHHTRKILTDLMFDVDKTIIEYCYYDSMISHDDEWLNP